MIEMQLKCVFCKRFLNSCLDIHNPTECTEFISPFEDIKECFQIPFLHVSGDEGICSECFIVIRFINAMKTHMTRALKNEKCTVITIFNKYKQILCSIQFQNNEHLEEMYATVCTETQPDQYKETRRARTPASGEVYGILKKNKGTKRRRVNSNMGRSSVNNVRTASRASSTASISSFASRGVRSEPVYDPDRCNLESRMGFDDFDPENEDDDDDDDEEKKRYGCRECSVYFSSKRKLLQHSTQNHSFCIYCPLCETLERNVVDLQEHLDYHRVVSIPCGFCDKSFVNYERLYEHRKISHKNKVVLLPPRIRMNVIFNRSLRYAQANRSEVVGEANKPFERVMYVNEEGNHRERFNHHDTYCLCMNEYLENDNIKMHDTYCSCKTAPLLAQSPRSDVDEFAVGTSIIYRERDTSDSSDPDIVEPSVPSSSIAPITPPLIRSPILDPNPPSPPTVRDPTPPPYQKHPSPIPESLPSTSTMPSSPLIENHPSPTLESFPGKSSALSPPPIQNHPSPISESLPGTSSAPSLALVERSPSPTPMKGFSPRNSTPPPVLEASPLLEYSQPLHVTVKQTKNRDPSPPHLSVSSVAAAPKNNGGIMAIDKASIYKQFIHDDSDKVNGCSDSEVDVQVNDTKRVTRSTGKPSCSSADGAIPSTSKQYYEQSRSSPVDKPKTQSKRTASKGNVNVKKKSPPDESGLVVVEVIKPPPNGETSDPKELTALEEDATNNSSKVIVTSESSEEATTKDGELMMDSQEVIQYEDIGTVEEIIESNWQDPAQDWQDEQSNAKAESAAKKRNFFDTFIKTEQQQYQQQPAKKSVYDTFICRGNSKNKRAKVSSKAKVAPILENLEVYVINPNSPGASKEDENLIKESAVPSTTQIDSLPGTSDSVKRSRNREHLLKLMDDLQKKKKEQKTVSSTFTQMKSPSATCTSSSPSSSTSSVLPSSPPIAIEKNESGDFLKKVAITLSPPIRKNKRKPNRPATKRLGMSNVVRCVNTPNSSELVQIEGELYTKNAYKHAKKKVKR
ncbi:PREDICTED: flocculation protein FLO11-like [Nicrophorus vespilloides]|uniref:Flocculation protein FLO11-like n=1 Tax=Nicrophorus vespilloides TaxID=110193 RepID=A0ABM1M7F1_NICVS|nr:PREDICTED: flocculation protein FLO11-like [Nicrophorus vespilloides]